MKQIILFFVLIILTSEKSDVYFSKEISSKNIVEMFKKLNIKLTGNVALKIHSGEQNGPYFLKSDFLQVISDYTNDIFVDCNYVYNSTRNSTQINKETLKING